MTGSRPLWIAHRGASYDAPENTLAAFRLAWDRGADGIEGDFRLTRDGIIVCMHDATTARVAPADLDIAGSTFDELRELDIGSWKDSSWSAERIPSLGEVLETVPPDGRIFMEIKSGPEILGPAAGVLEDSGIGKGQVVIISFNTDVISRAAGVFPDIKRLLLTDGPGRGKKPSLAEILRRARENSANGVDVRAGNGVDAGFTKALADSGLECHVWGVDDRTTARRLERLGVDSMTTDRPAWIRKDESE